MKTAALTLLAITAIAVPASLVAQDVPEITPREAATHMGQAAKICGPVQTTAYLPDRDRSPTVLRVGGTYPYERINVVIYGEDREKFSAPPEETYRQKEICVTGMVEMYAGSPSVVLSDPADIEESDQP